MLIPLTAATTEPVSLAEAKAHLRITHSADDAMIARQITAAREYVELVTGRALAAATYRWTSNGFSCVLELPLWPVASVTQVSYLDSAYDRVVVDPGAYRFDPDRRTLSTVDSWPYPAGSVNVEFTTAPALVPAALQAAILLIVGDLHANAEANIVGTIVSVNPSVMNLIFPHRVNLGV